MKSHSSRCCNTNRHHKHGVGFAALLIIAGALLLCSKIGIIPEKYIHVIISWQMLLIFIGFRAIFRRHFFAATALISVGVFFIIPQISKVPENFLSQIPANFVHLYWPILLIIAGILIMLRKLFPPRNFKFVEEQFKAHNNFKSQWNCENGYVNKNTVFESGEHIVLDPEFKGGEINTAFGETKLDLRKTNLPLGETTLEIKVTFGTVEIYVPTDWNIQMKVNSVLGSFEDKRSQQNPNTDQSRTLILYGSLAFSSGELKN